MSIVYAGIVLCALGIIRVEAHLRVYIDDIAINYMDPEYFDAENSDIWVVEGSTDENTITANVTFLKEPPPETQGHFQLMGLSMGKYDLPTGVDITMDLCDMIGDPVILGPFFAVFGLSAETCPPPPGVYYQEGYSPPMDNLPDDFPENKYIALFEIGLVNKPSIVVKVYLDVQG